MRSHVAEDLDEASEYILRIIDDLSHIDFSEVMQSELEDLEAVHQSYFDAQAGPRGEGWEPWFWRPTWAPSDHPTLEITGHLRQSLTIGGIENFSFFDRNSLEFGTTVDYAGIHNFGGEVTFTEDMVGRDGSGFKRRGSSVQIPQREHVGMSEEYVSGVVERIAYYVTQYFHRTPQ